MEVEGKECVSFHFWHLEKFFCQGSVFSTVFRFPFYYIGILSACSVTKSYQARLLNIYFFIRINCIELFISPLFFN
jgi:hypothetical protein